MNHSNLRKALFAAALVAGLGTVPFAQVNAQDSAAAMSKGDNQTVAGKADDTWITTKVKSEFAANKMVKATDISVSTTEGVVTLTGSVATAKEKSHAVAIAKKIKGVKSVDASGVTVSAAAAASN
ncbi:MULTISPECIES: BON domain-containing protein [unclassified Luteibacter]|jgi:hyperosmotically inducible protein|uniref:BON domain-containing protein n=1 Tax=unclassified Luteibacter TaxID=2620188 RepID=UPI00055F1C6A|nr:MULTISPECIES: BON domain-containing protein [unclassified Luteibacter]